MKQKKNAQILALLFAGACALPAHAQQSERESLETLRQTTLNLIDVLVSQGVMSREQASALVKSAEQKAAATVAEQQKNAVAAGAVAGAAAGAGGAQILTTGEKGRVRVSYIPDSVKNEIREQVRQEVVAQAKTERWGEPNALPDWIDRIKWEGDIRFRSQSEMMAQSNTPPEDYVSNTTTRAPDFGYISSNTQEDRDRLRIRARLGMIATVNEEVTAGFRLVTGSETDRVSTNQTLGNNFNKYSVTFDRAYLKYEPTEWLSLSGGRIPNPFFSTDLVYDENLNFEGVAATFGNRLQPAVIKPYATVGFFPMRAENPPNGDSRWLSGAQAGFEWNVSSRNRLKAGLAYYEYKNVEGRAESDQDYLLFSPAYGQYAYESGLRQKGNTLFRTNAAGDTTNDTIWGLASKFKPLNLTAVWDLAHFDPMHIIVTADYVKNLGYDKKEILQRTGLSPSQFPDGRDYGGLLKVQFGYPKVAKKHEWNASIAYRYLGSDAVLDAFTVADFGLGGTNSKGYILGFNYGIERNTTLGIRWLSSDSIDATIPDSTFWMSGKPRFGLDILQVDLTASF